jgi:hypothetical protein
MLSCLAPGGACEGSQKETAIQRSVFPYFYGVRSAILDRIHKGERADLPVQALTKVSLSSVSSFVARPPQ